MIHFNDMTTLGCDPANSAEEFFEKLLLWKNEEKPSEAAVATAKKFIEMMQERPLSLSVFEDIIIISYKEKNRFKEIEVKDSVGEFFTYKT
jgi:hypothetical protein